jgi:hypothetical protein
VTLFENVAEKEMWNNESEMNGIISKLKQKLHGNSEKQTRKNADSVIVRGKNRGRGR